MKHSKLKKYNIKHYPSDDHGPTDHLVGYGTFTEDVAKEMDLHVKLRDCRSIKDLVKYFIFPNNAFKYRQHGRYEVKGCKDLVDYIYKNHDGFKTMILYIGTFLAYHVLISSFIVRLYFDHSIRLISLIGCLLAQYLLAPLFTPFAYYFSANRYNTLRFAYLVVGALAVITLGSKLFLPILGAELVILFLVRQFKPEGAQFLFRDLKTKKKYQSFFKKYITAFNNVHP
ncbi:MAG: hypothetical protein GKR87_13075 [Kiritimatiellae bacterium]|nr:hypothetical protein [Kiritimatiellia bacterium]